MILKHKVNPVRVNVNWNLMAVTSVTSSCTCALKPRLHSQTVRHLLKLFGLLKQNLLLVQHLCRQWRCRDYTCQIIKTQVTVIFKIKINFIVPLGEICLGLSSPAAAMNWLTTFNQQLYWSLHRGTPPPPWRQQLVLSVENMGHIDYFKGLSVRSLFREQPGETTTACLFTPWILRIRIPWILILEILLVWWVCGAHRGCVVATFHCPLPGTHTSFPVLFAFSAHV